MALEAAGMKLNDLDAIAYTRGPGMYGCLSISAASARALAAGTDKPLVGVHHMQAHALTPLLTEEEPPEFPFLTLLVSGGHTQLVLAKTMDDFSIVADTLDNCIGLACPSFQLSILTCALTFAAMPLTKRLVR